MGKTCRYSIDKKKIAIYIAIYWTAKHCQILWVVKFAIYIAIYWTAKYCRYHGGVKKLPYIRQFLLLPFKLANIQSFFAVDRKKMAALS